MLMPRYCPPIDQILSTLRAFDYDKVATLPQYADYDLGASRELLAQIGRIATDLLLPQNRVGDRVGLKLSDAGQVRLPPGLAEAYRHMAGAGFVGLAIERAYGGGGAPLALHTAACEMWSAGNKCLAMIAALNHGLAEALCQHASAAIRETYVPKLAAGSWTAAMCLTESQAGTDLGLLQTRAEAYEQHFKLRGTKIWITFGEHDLTENIVYLVLARLPDAPPGTKGISAFVVPKFTRDGRRNGIRCIGLEQKMGIHASPTCVMSLEDAEGWLVGQPQRGLRTMFTMLNGARLAVGTEGVGLADVAYQTALAFARERRQGRSLDPAKRQMQHPADCITVHPDVRRMLLNIRISNQAMRGLVLWTANLVEIGQHHAEAELRQQAADLVGLLTPVVKAFGSELSFGNISEAMQVCGGAGYTTSLDIEQYLRDSRISMIYDGTNHVQALDLVGRKLPRDEGRGFQTFCHLVEVLTRRCERGSESLAALAGPLRGSLELLADCTERLAARGARDAEEIGAAASNYLKLFALTALSYSAVRQAEHALSTAAPDAASRVKDANYFNATFLPGQRSLAALVDAGKERMMCFAPSEL